VVTTRSLSWQSPTTHYPGELYQGGVVFWVDQTGSHGLICSMTDLSKAKEWSDVQGTLINETAQSELDGQTNSDAIIAQSIATSAADLCSAYTNVDYGTGVYSDWYLPAIGELTHLWNNLHQVQKALDDDRNAATTAIAKNNYWSSSEYNLNLVWSFNFATGDREYLCLKSNTYYVRAVRRF